MKLNWPIFAIAALFYYQQNTFFGWNALPQSEAELIADGITLILITFSMKG